MKYPILIIIFATILPVTAFAWHGDYSHLVCGDKLCSEIEQTPIIAASIAYFPPPLKQIAQGTDPSNVTCTEGLELILKMSNGNPACVKPSSIQKLIDRGWGIHLLPDIDDTKPQNSDYMKTGIYDVESSMVNYDDYAGFLAKPISEESFPGVVMIHEWWGLNDNIKETAEQLASHGYVVLAVDLYDGKVAADAQAARELIGSFDQIEGTLNMMSAVSYLQENHNTQKTGSIGWCFGGGQSLNLATHDHLDATVIYYGNVNADKESLSTIDWPVLGIFAELDQGIPVSSVKQFESSLNELQISNQIHIYPNVDHAFANPTGERYAPEEADDAWQKTIAFLESNLK